MREREIEKYLRTEVLKLGGRCYKFNGEAGVPDRIVILGGETVFVETKARRGRLSKIQKIQHARIHNAGGMVFTLASKREVNQFIIRCNPL